MKHCLTLLSLMLLPVFAIAQQTEGNEACIEDRATKQECDTAQAATALSTLRKKIKQKGNIFIRFIKNFDDYDTTYITPNYYNFTGMVQNTDFYQKYTLSGNSANGVRQSLHFAPENTAKVGPYFGYRWIFLGYTFDVGHPHKAGKSTEFNLSLYSSMLGCDFVYIRNTGDFKLRRVTGFERIGEKDFRGRDFQGLDTYTLSCNLYYVFNHRHFSYPAAFAQSTVQRKSCGSWMLGMRYDQQRMKFDHTLLPAELLADDGMGNTLLCDELKVSQISYANYSVSGGYAYNWVFAPQWLLAGSASPSMGLKKLKNERITGESLWKNVKNFNMDVIFRLGLVWNNTRWFAGASAVSHLYKYRHDNFSLTNFVSYVNVYVGFNFNKRKQYR